MAQWVAGKDEPSLLRLLEMGLSHPISGGITSQACRVGRRAIHPCGMLAEGRPGEIHRQDRHRQAGLRVPDKGIDFLIVAQKRGPPA